MPKKITSISYLKKNVTDNKVCYKRLHVQAITGKFLLEKQCDKRAAGIVQRKLCAYNFVIDDDVSQGDPVLTFEDGDKLRVYQGGDRTFMLTESRSLIDAHDSLFPKTRSPFMTTEDQCEYMDYGGLNYPWPGCP